MPRGDYVNGDSAAAGTLCGLAGGACCGPVSKGRVCTPCFQMREPAFDSPMSVETPMSVEMPERETRLRGGPGGRREGIGGARGGLGGRSGDLGGTSGGPRGEIDGEIGGGGPVAEGVEEIGGDQRSGEIGRRLAEAHRLPKGSRNDFESSRRPR